MARRNSAKAARKKDAKRQRAAEKRAEKLRARCAAAACTVEAAVARLAALRAAVARGEAPSPRGLVNLGNTCFFNSVMQCLARVGGLREYFVGGAALPGEGVMTTALRGFLVEMWKLDDSSVFNPNQLFTEVGKRNPSFEGRAQQDAHELMKVVFDAVVEEEKVRLRKVAKGLLSDVPAGQEQESSSDSTSPNGGSADDMSDSKSPSPVRSDLSAELSSDGDGAAAQPMDDGGQPLPDGDASDKTPEADVSVDCPDGPVEGEEENKEEKDIDPARLITIIERTFGGSLSSTILCKECGTKSSVTEPFFDLQLPLIPKDESDVESDKSRNAGKTGSSSPDPAAQESEQHEPAPQPDSSAKPEGPEASAPKKVFVSAAPPPPPPLPPPPPPPPPSRNVADSVAGGDFMKELGQKVARVGEEPVQERQLIVYNGPDIQAGASSGDDAAGLFDDDDEVEGYGLSSLFDDDFGGANDSAMDDIGNMTAFSTSDASREQSATKSPSKPAKAAPAPPAPSRRTSSFISSFFNPFSGASAAPHGYRSVVGSLEGFTKVEVLEGDNAYGCEECTRREKLRVALQKRSNIQKSSAKIIENVNDDAMGDAVSCDDGIAEEELSEGSATTGGDTTVKNLNGSGQKSKAPDVTKSDPQVLVSSPVTSSESSSGVSSEDDGELVIEEELEQEAGATKGPKCVALSREEEDQLIKELKVEVPTVRTSAEKRFMVKKAPKVLSIQLKRFTQINYRGVLRKISGHVDFPLTLDLSPFVEEDSSNDENDNIPMKPNAKRKRSGVQSGQKSEKKGFEYVLTGVSVHGGSLSGGHYTAYVREGVEPDSRGGWYFCNDSRIQRASEKAVLNSEAYLLYYERVG